MMTTTEISSLKAVSTCSAAVCLLIIIHFDFLENIYDVQRCRET